jgi:two-component system, chemotaxis family, chemotaxis protein CheY
MKTRILIVDDSESIRELVGSSLRENGFEVFVGTNGRDACQQLETTKVDLIITDLNMPEMDGLMLVRAVRKDPRNRFLPILILTTESEAKKRERAKSEGATGWIVKPFDKERLLKIINKVVR